MKSYPLNPPPSPSSRSGSIAGVDAPVQYLKGIGPVRADLLEQHGVRTIRDLLFYIPRRYLDRSTVVTIDALRRRSDVQEAGGYESSGPSGDVTVVGEVRSFRVAGMGRKARFVLVLADQTGSMQCVWFGGVKYWREAFAVGETLAVSGQPSYYGTVLQFVHPAIDRLAAPENAGKHETPDDIGNSGVDWSATLHTGGLIPLYPSGADLERVGLDSGGFRRVISGALRSHLDTLQETLPAHLITSRQLLPLQEAIRQVHFPQSTGVIAGSLHRLKYEEFFYFQLKLALKRRSVKVDMGGIPFRVESALARQLVDSLPFTLTRAQVRVIREITSDMQSPKPLNRLLQGDVGSGKTIVALLCMLIAVENGFQAAFMAPTEILAEQHYKTLNDLLGELPVRIRLLTGGQRSKLRREVLDAMQRGSAQIVVGTHALFEKGVEFANLGFVVIDEQHRFGVLQRASMRQKGVNPDVLVMTATPIPRTLSLTLYGDLDVSVLDELPGGRKPIKTILRYEHEQDAVYRFVREQITLGRQAYIVYPLIEESEKLDLKAATVHYEHLRQDVFPELRLGLLHGRLRSEEKDAVMQQFKHRQIDLLVATTVIEVGIDVPNAAVMVIENAERFGLSQLHQLRGRVGRGTEQSYCILLAADWVAGKGRRLARLPMEEQADQQHAVRRLNTMVATTDGFRIAEVDLELRGPGDFFGTRQSGVPEFKVANLITDTGILETARKDAFTLVERDPKFSLAEHQVILHHLRSHFSLEWELLHVA